MNQHELSLMAQKGYHTIEADAETNRDIMDALKSFRAKLSTDNEHTTFNLSAISSYEQFADLYEGLGLSTVAAKIDFLKTAIRLRASICSVQETPEEELSGLEDLVLSHTWEALQ